MTRRATLLLLTLSIATTLVATSNGAWLAKVPPHEHDKVNPYRGQPDAISGGQRVFHDHCAHCHGENAEGTRKRPSLRTERVQQQATEGDLHWLLVNGNMKFGMPTWGKLGDPQIWQVITYVKSLHREQEAR